MKTMKTTSSRLAEVPSLSVGVALVGLFGLVSAGPALAAGQGDSGVTFHKDIAPIIQRSCQNCHRPGAMAPMSLLTYDEVRPWAGLGLSLEVPVWGSLDPAALALTAAAMLATFRFRVGMGPLLAAWAALGLAWSVLNGAI